MSEEENRARAIAEMVKRGIHPRAAHLWTMGKVRIGIDPEEFDGICRNPKLQELSQAERDLDRGRQ
ncbi:MAG: hypothetical protein LBT81_05675 [Helicobacteraceae bacterium]|jgi:trehalose-6-phosphate synthase|nr:hypothetical protein [Helicobacteraceae bacterium]